jgi:hypothetical protein
MRRSCSLLSHIVLSSGATKRGTHAALILKASTDRDKSLRKPGFARRHANGRRQGDQQSRCHHTQFCLLRLQQARPRFWDAAPPRLRMSTDSNGGSCYSGPHKTVAEGDRAPACTLADDVTTSQVKLCERRHRMALLLLGVEQRNPRWRRQVYWDTLALLAAVLLGLGIGLYIVFCPTECH